MTAVRQHRDECRLWASLRWALCCVCFLSVFVRAWISGRAKVSLRAYVCVCVCIFVSCFRLHVGGVCLHVCVREFAFMCECPFGEVSGLCVVYA